MSTKVIADIKQYMRHATLSDLLEGVPLPEHNAYSSRALEIMNNLVKFIDTPIPFPIRLIILETDEENGFSEQDGDVAITTGALNNFTDDQIAVLLAHELGHIVGGLSNPKTWNSNKELPSEQIKADRFGVMLARKAGYAKSLEPIIDQLSSNPENKERIKALRQIDAGKKS